MSFSLRISIGVVKDGEVFDTPDAVVNAADEALYEAKRAGRDRVSAKQ